MRDNLRSAVRQLRHSPGFTLTVILTLALGIGSTTAIFSLVEGILLRPLPFQDADRLVLVGDHLGASPNISVTAREIATYSSATEAFSSIGGFITTSYELAAGQKGVAQPEQMHAARISADVLKTLGVGPLMGRVFTSEEELRHEPLAILSYPLWTNRYHRDPQIVGATIALDRRAYTIIGVMPRGFEFPLEPGRLEQSLLWVPLSLTPDELSDRRAGVWSYRLIARLKPGVGYPQAAQDADRVVHQVMREFPPSMSALKLRGDVEPVRENAVSEIRPLLATLFVAVSVVLGIACVNVAGLLLLRAIRRRREYAVRLAVGAPARAIVLESMLEGLLLSISGGALGLALAAGAVRAALHLLPDSMPRINSIAVDLGVSAFALAVSIATGVLCSIAPAFAGLRIDIGEALKDSMRTTTGGTSHSRLRAGLVVAEIAIALILLTVSGAFLRSFENMRAVDPGFRPENVLVAGYQLPVAQYSTRNSVNTFNRAVVEQLATEPAVTAVGISNALPGANSFGLSAFTIEGQPVSSWKLQFAAFGMVDGEYFRAMSIPVIEGRTFTENDRAESPLVVVVNRSMAEHSWPGQSAVGKRMHVGNPQKGLPWAQVVGIVADTKLGSRDEPSRDQWYAPVEQQAAILEGREATPNLTSPVAAYVVLRSALPPEQMARTLRSAIARIDPLLALDPLEPMTAALANVEAPRRFNTTLITAFAASALVLAITGIYALVAFSASERVPEMAIRMALGAQRVKILRLVLASGAKLALAGCALGILGSLLVAGLVKSFLFNVSATNPLIYAASALLMLLMALVASALPAVRAARVDPILTLRAN
jgi:putative ABC transport system permease protein